jgi:hypothetical protein
MTRVVSVGRSKGILLASALGTVFLISSLSGCPGTLDPTQFPPMGVSTGGTTGAAGTTGTAGTGAGGVMGCANAPAIFVAHTCTIMGACHDADGTAAGFKMDPAGWEKNLVGVMSKGGGAALNASKCGASGIPYLAKTTQPATGLFLAKLSGTVPPCGAKMPNVGSALTATEFACVQAWANALVAATP